MWLVLLYLVLGAILWEALKRLGEQYKNPYKISCVHCKNGGGEFTLSGNDPIILGQVMDEHKREVHPNTA